MSKVFFFYFPVAALTLLRAKRGDADLTTSLLNPLIPALSQSTSVPLCLRASIHSSAATDYVAQPLKKKKSRVAVWHSFPSSVSNDCSHSANTSRRKRRRRKRRKALPTSINAGLHTGICSLIYQSLIKHLRLKMSEMEAEALKRFDGNLLTSQQQITQNQVWRV